jgi:hypothetical protein
MKREIPSWNVNEHSSPNLLGVYKGANSWDEHADPTHYDTHQELEWQQTIDFPKKTWTKQPSFRQLILINGEILLKELQQIMKI